MLYDVIASYNPILNDKNFYVRKQGKVRLELREVFSFS
nr:MAG TPA: DNA binding protein [Caudoviricetes sp.]